MNSVESWLPKNKIDAVVQPELLFLVIVLALSAWIFYKLFLKAVSPERHKNLRGLFKNLLFHCVTTAVISLVYWTMSHIPAEAVVVARVVPYLGFAALIWGCTVFIKTCRIFLFEYLFLSSMTVGVPLLIVNLMTVTLSIILGAWILSGVFEVRLAPLLATSTIFSIVLGLALQDTLGNAIAGVALQVDKPYEIGDWIEVTNTFTHQKFIGQVYEITWRSTLLISMTEEFVTVPNRIMAQAEISNFSAKVRPFIRGQFFRIPFGTPPEKVKQVLLAATAQVPAVRRIPAPLALMFETTESWILFKLIYYIDDYGRQFIIGDEVVAKCLEALANANIRIAANRIDITRESPQTV